MGPVSLSLALLAAAPIETVTIGPRQEFLVNGRPVIPLTAWLQDPGNFELLQSAGCNTTAGYWPGSGGTKNVAEYLDRIAAAGLWGVLPYDPALHGHPALLSYIHDDEPDLSREESDAEVIPDPGLRLNRSNPLWKILDGTTTTWSVLDPLAGAGVTFRFKQPVTVREFALWATVSGELPVAREIRLLGDGRELLRATLENKRGRQPLPLPQPATFTDLRLEVLSTYPGNQVWGSLGELEGLGPDGRQVLVSPPRKVPKQPPEETLERYRQIKAADPTRPVWLTLTARYMPEFKHWPDEVRQRLYPAYVQAADVVGTDIYPLYGWGRPDWLDRVAEGMRQLAQLAGERPVYQWIETSAGGQYTGDKAPAVTGAHIRNEVWQALCAGATAIGYFTHVWKPSYKQFGVPPENIVAMRQVNDQITRLTPAILAEPAPVAVTITLTGDLKALVLARVHEGALYLFAVNHDPSAKAGEATLTVPGLPAGRSVEVIDENRTLTTTAGGFSDRFEGLAVHLYRLPDWR